MKNEQIRIAYINMNKSWKQCKYIKQKEVYSLCTLYIFIMYKYILLSPYIFIGMKYIFIGIKVYRYFLKVKKEIFIMSTRKQTPGIPFRYALQ